MKQQIVTETVQALDSFYFSIQEYACDGGKDVTMRAKEYLSQRFGDSPFLEKCLSTIIRVKYQAMIMASVCWLKLPSECLSEISFSRLEKTVSGKAQIEPKRVYVELPIAGKTYSKESILLTLTPRIYTEAPFIGSPPNSDGEECAKMLFLKLYYETIFLRD